MLPVPWDFSLNSFVWMMTVVAVLDADSPVAQIGDADTDMERGYRIPFRRQSPIFFVQQSGNPGGECPRGSRIRAQAGAAYRKLMNVVMIIALMKSINRQPTRGSTKNALGDGP